MNTPNLIVGGGIESLISQQRGAPVQGTGELNFREEGEPAMRMAGGGQAKAKKLETSDIIEEAAKQYGKDPDEVLRAIYSHIATEDGFILRHNNTVVFFEPIDGKTFASHLFTQDEPVTLTKAITHIVDALQKKKIKSVYGQADSTQIINVIRLAANRAKAKLMDSDRKPYNWKVVL